MKKLSKEASIKAAHQAIVAAQDSLANVRFLDQETFERYYAEIAVRKLKDAPEELSPIVYTACRCRSPQVFKRFQYEHAEP